MLELMKKYMVCPKCNNEYIGNGKGSLVVDDNTFTKTCGCGWMVKVDEDDNPV